MLGITQFDGSIYIFLEDKDIPKLGRETITGTYLSRKNTRTKGTLELSTKKITNTLEYKINQTDNSIKILDTITDHEDSIIKMSIQIDSGTYLDIMETGNVESYIENTKIYIYDANKVLDQGNAFDQVMYGLLKTYKMQLSNKKVKNPNIWNRLWLNH
jgi:hypothetical protein